MKRKYRYLIVSQYSKSNGSTGFSEDIVAIDYKLNTVENINKVREGIKRQYNFDIMIILNIIKLKK